MGGTSSTLLTSVAQYFEHSRWRMLYQRHLKAMVVGRRPAMVIKAQTFWMTAQPSQYQPRLRLETWIEEFKTTTVTTGHSLVDPSTNEVLAKAMVAIASRDHQVLPNRPGLEDLVEKDHNLPLMDLSYQRLCCTIDTTHTEPVLSFPFMVGPNELDALGELNQAHFVRYFETARYQAFTQIEHKHPAFQEFPAAAVFSLEYLQHPEIGAVLQVFLWGATVEPASGWVGGDVLMELRGLHTNQVYTRCSVEVHQEQQQLEARL